MTLSEPDGFFQSCVESVGGNLELRVKIGTTKFSGTDNTVSVRFASDSEVSTWFILDNWGNDFESGSTANYSLKLEEFGEIERIDLKLEGLLRDKLFLDFVAVKRQGEKEFTRFVYYQWVRNEVSLIASRASLPQSDSKIRSQWRKRHLDYFRSLCPWDFPPTSHLWYEGLVVKPYFKDQIVPMEISWPAERNDVRIERDSLKGKLENLLRLTLASAGTELETVKDYEALSRALANSSLIEEKNKPFMTKTLHRWNNVLTDDYFSHFCLNSSIHRRVSRAKSVLPSYRLTDEALKDYGLTIQSAIDKGLLYVIDLSDFDEYPTVNLFDQDNPIYICNPICYFLLQDQKLKVLGIQLTSHSEDPVFTPNDSKFDWLAAKACLSNMAVTATQLIDHLSAVHLINEAFAVSLFRNLTPAHPIYKMLYQHISRVISSNVMISNNNRGDTLVGEKGRFSKYWGFGNGTDMKVLQRSCQRARWSDIMPENDLKTRGFHDIEIKEYMWKDEVMLYVEAIRTYVSGIVDLFYDSDDAVLADTEIQKWIEEVVKIGLSGLPQFGLAHILNTKQQLVSVCSTLIFQGSIGHTVFQNLDEAAIVPFMPLGLRRPAPNSKGITEEEFIQLLPDKLRTFVQIIGALGLVIPPKGSLFIGEFEFDFFSEEEVLKLQSDFSEKIREIGDEIRERNKSRKYPSDMLLPERIAARINI